MFPQRNNRLVWEETTRVVEDLFEKVWGDADEVVLDNAYEVTLQVRRAKLPPISF